MITAQFKSQPFSICSLTSFIFWLGVGLFATFSMDLWGVILNLALHMPQPNYALLGQYLFASFHGQAVWPHLSITSAHTIYNTIGWFTHVMVGLVDAALYMLFIFKILKTTPHFFTSIFFAWMLMFMPFLIEQPLLGMGVAGALTAHPDMTRLITLSYHTIFGIGMYAGSHIFNRISKHCRNTLRYPSLQSTNPGHKHTIAMP